MESAGEARILGSRELSLIGAPVGRKCSRMRSAEEIAIGKAAIEDFAKQWPARLASDNGDAPHAATAQWLALENYCHSILNSAEFSFID